MGRRRITGFFRRPWLFLAAALALAPRVPAAGDERFGVMTHFAQGWDLKCIPLISAGGVSQVRDELYWADVEAEKGRFKFPAGYDRYLDALAQNGITPLIVLSFENPHYDGGQTPYTDEGFAAYARYAVEVLRHAGPRVKAVEIWNEYNGSFNHGPASADRAATYLKMLRVAYAAIKRERPDVTVVAGATAGVPYPYLEKLFAGGGLECMDALSIHPYRYGSAPEGIEDDIAGVRRLMGAHGTPKPVWVSEIGWQLKPSKAEGDLLVDEAVQARFLARAYGLLLSAGVEHIYWYLFRDHQDFAMGLVRNDDPQTPRPAYHALATLSRQLQGAQFVRREAAADGVYSLVFRRRDGGEVRMLWSLQPVQLKLAGAQAVTGLDGRPVPVQDGLQLGDSPVFVTGPLRDFLPALATRGRVIADAARDFPLRNAGEWSYGAFADGGMNFQPLPNYAVTDWKAEWAGAFPYLSVTASDQHPSAGEHGPVAAVRRWTSRHAGAVRVTGSFRCGTEGDGIGVSVVVDGRPRFRKLLGGGGPVVEQFDFTLPVHAGTTIDFAVDPGPGRDIDHDVTAVAVVVRAAD